MKSYTDMLHRELVDIRGGLSTAREFFQQCVKKLLSNGYVTDEFYDAIITREKEYPTGLQFEDIAIAIPHTDVQYVNKPFIYINRVEDTNLKFIHMGTDDQLVKPELIVILGITDPKDQVDLLSFLMKLFSDKEFIRKIKESKNEKELFDIFSEGISKGEQS